MSNVAFIPVRGGSTSIPLKNIKPMCGKPLVYWTAAAAAASKYIDTVYVSTDSEAIRAAVEGFGIAEVKVIGRSAETATATASSESALLEFAESHAFERVAFIQATSPLLTSDDVDRAFEMLEDGSFDSVLSVVEDKHFYWRRGNEGAVEVNYDVYARPRRQDFEGWYQENGAIYVTDRERLLESKNRVSGRIGLLEMAPETAFEIDEPSDWVIIEALLARREPQGARRRDSRWEDIRLFLTDCDGCLTDGGMYYSERGDELKRFSTRDGMAFQLLHEAGIKCGIVTGENRELNKRRAEKLRLDYLVQGCKDKLAAVSRICEELDITLSNVAYVGDDINDLEILKAVREAGGIAACPSDAIPQAKAAATFVSETRGGNGAVRSIAEKVIAGSADSPILAYPRQNEGL